MEAALKSFRRSADGPREDGSELPHHSIKPEVVRLILRSRSSIEPVEKLSIQSELPPHLDWGSVPKAVREAYRHYETLPRSKSEWEARGQPAGGWNGDALHLIATQVEREGGRWVTKLEVRQAPYKLLNADIDTRTAGTGDLEWGARQLHVGVLAVVSTPEGPAAIGQLRGRWVERGGTVHPLLIAGGVSTRNFGAGRDPFRSALQQERLQELKQAAPGWEISGPLYILHEGGRPAIDGGPPGTALYCNVAHVLRAAGGSALTLAAMEDQFREYSERLAARGIDPAQGEVGGWVVIPLHGGAFALNSQGELVLKDVVCYRPFAEGGISRVIEPELPLFSAAACRPFLDFVDADSNLRQQVLQQAGLP